MVSIVFLDLFINPNPNLSAEFSASLGYFNVSGISTPAITRSIVKILSNALRVQVLSMSNKVDTR